MAVLASDLIFVKTATNLGGAATSTQATGGNVFDAFTGSETSSGTTVYACIYAKNDAAETAFAAKVYVDSETAHPGANISIGLGTSAINGTEQTIANETTAPSGVTFSEADGSGNALAIGDMAAGATKAVWLRFNIDPSTAANNNYALGLALAADSGA